MISFGKNLCILDDELSKIDVATLFKMISEPDNELVSTIRQLRIIQNIDIAKYRQQKRALPYIVCSIFNPPFRRKDNFAYLEYFIVDIDHITAKGLSLDSLKQTIVKDDRVVLCYVSPGGDGLKIMFKLDEKCYDPGIYSLFYKEFCKRFASINNLEQVIDSKTCDVSRACFISADADAFFNPDATPVDIRFYVDIDNPDNMLKQKSFLEHEMANEPESPFVDTLPADPDCETVARIKAILDARVKPPVEQRQVYVPEVLEELIDDLKSYIEQTGAIVTEIRNIQYGKKLHVRIGRKEAEANLFYGKHGFTVVDAPRRGTSEEMNGLLVELIETFVAMYQS